MIEIRRGSTPTIEVETEVDISECEEIFAVIRQDVGSGCVCVEKTLTKDSKVIDENHFSFKLTQEETLALSESKRAELQLKAKTVFGDVLTGDIIELNIRRVLKEEVI